MVLSLILLSRQEARVVVRLGLKKMIDLTTLVRTHLAQDDLHPSLHPIKNGASGRKITRCITPEASFIAIEWDSSRADNNSFVLAAHHLAAHGVNVPAIYAIDTTPNGGGIALAQDLGDDSLMSHKGKPWAELRPLYRAAMEQAHKLHQVPIPTDFALQPKFDAALYKWEQSYFFKHHVGGHLFCRTTGMQGTRELRRLATWLGAQPTCLIHRDLQSQNVHFHAGQAHLIDFQGMRLGLPEYDIASLVYDPYMNLTPEQQDDLILDWQDITQTKLNLPAFYGCALQRLMQALGAFSYIGYSLEKNEYLDYIPAGERQLARARRSLRELVPDHAFVSDALEHINSILSQDCIVISP